jgi:hypothetical protein
MGTGVGARGTSCKWLPTFVAGFMAIGRKTRSEPAVLAATLSESVAGPNEDLLFQSVFVILALFLDIGPSSPSVPSSYPDVFPPVVAGFIERPLPRGRLTEALEDGRDVFALPLFPEGSRLSFSELTAFEVSLNWSTALNWSMDG